MALPRGTLAVSVQAFVRAFARRCGASARDEWLLAIAASEAATNVEKFGVEGVLTLRYAATPAPAVELIVDDRGPGVADVAWALVDGVSEGVDLTTLTSARVERRGLGTGLGAIRRSVHELAIVTRPEGGTRLVARRILGREGS